ncbi:MAG: tetratricopeptide repeat protein, partial [Verrucomicrobiia bacterium]
MQINGRMQGRSLPTPENRRSVCVVLLFLMGVGAMLGPLCHAQSGRSPSGPAPSVQRDSPDFIKDLIETRRRYREAFGATGEATQRSTKPVNRSPRARTAGSQPRRLGEQSEASVPVPARQPGSAARGQSSSTTTAPPRRGVRPSEALPRGEEIQAVENTEEEGAVSAPAVESGPAYPVPERRQGGAVAPLPEPARKGFEEAMRAFAERDYESARRGFERVLEIAPDHPVVLVNLGTVCWRLGEIGRAIDYLAGAVSRDLNNAPAWLGLGIVRFETGDLPGAHAALAQAHYLDPRNPRVNNYLGVTMTRLNHYDAAESFILDAIDADPGYAEAHFNLAVVYLRREPVSPELARRHYQRSLDLGGEPDAGVEA